MINQALLKLTPSTEIRSRFIRAWMQSGAFRDSLREKPGGATIQNVASVKILKQISTPLPPLASIYELKASLLHEAFAGNL